MAQDPYYIIRKHERLDDEGNVYPGSELFQLFERYVDKDELLKTTNTFESILEEKKKHLRNLKVAELNKQKSDLMLIIDDFVELTKEYMTSSTLDKEELIERRNVRARELVDGTEVYRKSLSEVGVVNEEE